MGGGPTTGRTPCRCRSQRARSRRILQRVGRYTHGEHPLVMVGYFISNVDVCVAIPQDVYPILKAVHEAAIDGGPLWKSLVRAGIADGLCQTFIDLKVPRDYSIDEVLPPILLDSCLTLTDRIFYRRLHRIISCPWMFSSRPPKTGMNPMAQPKKRSPRL